MAELRPGTEFAGCRIEAEVGRGGMGVIYRGTELQLGLVANGQGLGLVPEPLLAASRHHEALDVLNVSDFKPQVDLWLFHPRYLGNLQEPVELFGKIAGGKLAG